ncbi:MAG: hypothetical protein CML23_02245 [Rhizobiaceae bacterium]|nr:hypothetical protein [Rhizobiaceae bacterium]
MLWEAQMYLRRLKLVNTGPIERADISFRFGDEGLPKPVIFVGQNGSGKSVAISHIVNALIAAQGIIFEDSDVEEGKVYKLRSPSYIRHGENYSVSEVHLSDNIYVHEMQLAKTKSDFTEPVAEYPKWSDLKPRDATHFSSNFNENIDKIKTTLLNHSHLFFPPNRFEEPDWLNRGSLRTKVTYPSITYFENHSNRPIVNYAPMGELQNWLLDLVYDSFVLERPISSSPEQENRQQPTERRNRPATTILKAIEEFLRVLFGKPGKVVWNVGARNRRQLGVSIDGETMTSNLFQLSSGQAVLLDLFLSIIRDFDLGQSQLTQLSDIEGLVIVDEVDLHLHTDLQHDLLPNIIHLFPKIQFVLTTHSPLFLIGMEKLFTSEGLQLVELPTGHEIEVERFSEFETAYKHMKASARFQEEVREMIKANPKPVVYLEGTTDIDYLTKAGELLGKDELVRKFKLIDAVGFRNLDKIWETYKTHFSSLTQEKCLLLYDCDAGKKAESVGNLYRRTIAQQAHKIESGIENLFRDATIQKARAFKPAFVDIKSEHTLVERGVEMTIPETWKVNKSEKRNLCDWLCENGTADDFQDFSIVFDILEDVLSSED